MPKCPECGSETYQRRYSDVMNRKIEVGVKCPQCKASWRTQQEFDQYCQQYQELASAPQKICRVCGKDAKHRLDSPFRALDPSGPAICSACLMCPTCGVLDFHLREDGAVACGVCDAYWSTVQEFEKELGANAWVLGLVKN